MSAAEPDTSAIIAARAKVARIRRWIEPQGAEIDRNEKIDWTNLGQVKVKFQFFRKAVQLDPDYLEAHACFAGMLLNKGELGEALRQNVNETST